MTTRHDRDMWTRRGVLRGLGAASAMTLLTPFMSPGRARATPAGATASRIIFVTIPDGLEEGWFPTGSERDFALSSVLTSLEPFKRKLLILGGLKGSLTSQLEAHVQGPASLWTGSKIQGSEDVVTAPSIDQLIAQAHGANNAFTSLHFGSRSEVDEDFGGVGYMHHLGPNQPIPPQDDPSAMYATLFGSAQGRDDTQAVERARRKQKSVLDFVAQRIRAVEAQVALEDRERLEAHLSSVRSLERSMDALAEAQCKLEYPEPGFTSVEQAREDANFPTVVDVQMDLLVLALRCDLTRVATLQLSNTGGGIRIPGVNEDAPLHEVMHNRPKAERVRINRWFIERFAALLQRLEAVQFADGSTLLDDTLVVCSSEMGTGN
ncbi:MAG: DUF1552 domain-containing protein, partial [Myxococcota bacterium]